MTDTQAQELAASVLRQGEQLIWWQAAPSAAGPGAWLAAIAFTVMAALFGWVVFCAATSNRRPNLSRWQIAAVAFVFVLLPAAGALYFWAQTRGLVRAYAITNTRVMIVDNNPWLWVDSYGADSVTSIDRRGDTVSFNYGRTKGGEAYRTHLRGLREPERVEHLIIQHVRSNSSASTESPGAPE